MKSTINALFISLILFLLFASSCEKTEPYVYYENQVFVRAVPGDQRVKLYFYLCNQNGTNFPISPGFGCSPEFNAYFDIYQMNPDGTEKAKIASNVTDSFYVEGLTNGVNASFKLKARVGRNWAGESGIVVATPDIYPKPERIQMPFPPTALNLFYSYSPDLNKKVQPVYQDTFSGVEILQSVPEKRRLVELNFAGTVNWDASSRYFMGLTYNFSGSASIYYTVPYLYDTQADTLRYYNNMGNYDFQVPFLSADRQRIYFLSNQHNTYQYGLWTANVDGSQKQRLAPGFKFTYANPDYLYNQSSVYLSESNDGSAIYASFYTYSGNEEDGLYQINPVTGEFVRLLDENWSVQLARPSPDNRRIVFASSKSGALDFWLFDLTTGGVRQVTSLPTNVALNSFNPVYWVDDNHIYISLVDFTGYVNYKINIR